MELTDTITLPELIWTMTGAFAALGHIFVIRFFFCRIRDAIAALRPTATIFLGKSNLARHVLKLFAQLLAIGAGIYQMTQPPINPAVPVTTGAVYTTLAIVGMEIVLFLTSYIEVYTIQHIGGMAKRETDSPGVLPTNVVR